MKNSFSLIIGVCILLQGLLALEGPYTLQNSWTIPFHVNLNGDYCDLSNKDYLCGPVSSVSGVNPLPDLGYSGGPPQNPNNYAIIAGANGVDIWDVTLMYTDGINASRHQDFYSRCVSEARDTAVWYNGRNDETLYVVNDYSPHCACDPSTTLCGLQMKVETNSILQPIQSFEVTENTRLTPALGSGILNGPIVYANPRHGCGPLIGGYEGMIVMFDKTGGNCTFEAKYLNIQAYEPLAMVIVNDRNDTIYPQLPHYATSTFKIPTVIISNVDANTIVNTVTYNASLSGTFRFNSTKYQPAQGLTIIDLSQLRDYQNSSMVTSYPSLKEFNYAVRLYIDRDTDPLDWPYMLVVGSDTFGGVITYDVTVPTNPQLVSIWNDAFLTDVVHQQCVLSLSNKVTPIVFGVSPATSAIYVIDMKSPTNPQVLSQLPAGGIPSRIWNAGDAACDVLYVSYLDSPTVATFQLTWRWPTVSARIVNRYNYATNTSEFSPRVYSSRLYIVGEEIGVSIYDLSSSDTSPVLKARFTNETQNPFVHDIIEIFPDTPRFLFSANKNTGLNIIAFDPDVNRPIAQESISRTPLFTAMLICMIVFALLFNLIAFIVYIRMNWTAIRESVPF